MVIQCDKCQTKFRLDDSKVTGAGVKVRCTKCQNVFIVRPPGYQEAPPPPPPPPAPEKDEFEFKTPDKGIRGQASEESGSAEQKDVDDIMKEAFGGGMTHPAEAGDTGGEAAGGSTEALKESLRKEDTKIHAEEFVKEKETAAAAKPAREGMGAIIAAIIIIIVAAAVYFTGAVQIVKNAVSPPPPAVKAVDVESVSGYFVENKDFGKVFVIEAVIRNTTAAPQNVRGVVGIVYDSKGAKLASRPGAPGRIISKEDLKNLSKDDLVKAVKSAAEAGSGAIPGRASVPVMIVFTETPSGMSEYGIEVGR